MNTSLDNHEKVNSLLELCQQGDDNARDELFKVVYPELKRIAIHRLYKQSSNITAQATEIVNELYIKLSNARSFPAKSRLYFFSIAAVAIEQIVIDFARQKATLRRGGHLHRVDLENKQLPAEENINMELLHLGQLIFELKKIDKTAASILSLKLFTDMRSDDISSLLEVSVRTVDRKWSFAKSYIQYNMQE